jgi:16S rRNA (uracil1498-N3)-methyltransferase
MELFFAEPDQISDNRIILDEFESKHIQYTLKKKAGDIILITDGKGNLYHAKILKLSKRVGLEYHRSEKFEKTYPEITLAVGFIRPNRLDILLEKCTEIGVSKFILFRSQFVNYISFNTERLSKILRQAVKQSLQFFLPTVTVIDQFKQFFNITTDYDSKIVAYEPESPGFIKNLDQIGMNDKKSVLLTIGPEGGFSEIEIEEFLKNNFLPVSLGRTRLRTETAAISGVSVLKSYIQYKKEMNIGNR